MIFSLDNYRHGLLASDIKRSRGLFTTFIILILATFGHCQVVINGTRVKGLHYDSTVAGGQSASFTFTPAVRVGTQVTALRWYVDGSQVTGSITSMTYKSIGVAKHTASIEADTPSGTITASKTFASIGGPLDYLVMDGQCDATKPEHDDGELSNPWYIEYFGYVASEPRPSGAEPAQVGGVIVKIPQLSGTTYAWSVQGPAIVVAAAAGAGCTVYPCAGSNRGGIRVTVTYQYTDTQDATLSGTATDDSLETPPRDTTTVNANYYRFTSHAPTTVTVIRRGTYKHEQGGQYPFTGTWAYQDTFYHRVFDQNGDGQPAVWLAERFPGSTTAIADWCSAWGQNLSFENMGNNGATWTTLMGTPGYVQGEVDNLDVIGLEDVVANEGYPDPSAYGPLILTQNYYAATRNTALGAWGQLIRSWTNTMRTTSVSHD